MVEYKVPYHFVAGTRARASQVNANFDYVTAGLQNLDTIKAQKEGDASQTFSVAEPVQQQHAVTKRYVDLAIASAGGGGGNGVGKTMFEVFHTLSTKTPPGAFSLRTGELIDDAENRYPAFWQQVQEQGTGVIPDLTSGLPADYVISFYNVPEDLDTSLEAHAFSPYSWFNVPSAPSSEEPIVVQLEMPDVISCSYFKLNSHVFNTYDSIGAPDPHRAVKTASISVRTQDGNWTPVAMINDSELPDQNSRYFINEYPELEFDAMRIVVAANYGADSTDISLYPVDPESSSIRVVSEEQWQWEVEHYKETGAFVLNETESTIRLPKINRILSGVSDLWQVGIPGSSPAGGASIEYDEDENALMIQTTSDVSINTVSVGLWIQVYNAVSEESLASVVGVPHGQLFEEQLFRFIPEEESGWFPVTTDWFDGTYFTDAMSELMNQHGQAVSVANANYKLAPNGMKFVTDDLYKSTLATYGECPYYVVDFTNMKFKVPVSNNYRRCTISTDNMGKLLQDAAPNIIAGPFIWRTGTDRDSQIYGAMQIDRSVANCADTNDNENNGPRYTFDASRSNSAYGRANEVQPKSSYYLLCVFLGNEIPKSSSVNALKRIKSCETDLKTLAAEQAQLKDSIDLITGGSSEISSQLSAISTAVANNSARLDQLSSRLDDLAQQILNNTVRIAELESKQASFSVSNNTLVISDNSEDV